jgi:hypothetical protein
MWNIAKRKQISFHDILLHEGSAVAIVLKCFNLRIPDPVDRHDK